MAKIQLMPGASDDSKGQMSVGAIAPFDTARVFPEIGGSIDSVRQEIDDAFADMKTFVTREPDEIMRICSGHSARLSEVRVRIQRVEDFHRQWRAIRTRELEATLEELQNQYAIASRLLSAREFDWRMEMGER